MKRYILNKIDSIILTAVFCLLIGIPFIAGIIEQDQSVSSVEKRNLATLPPLPKSIEEITKYPKAFNSYYSDHFGYREKLTKRYFKLISKLGEQSSVDDVTIGQDGWLFLGSVKPGYSDYGDPFSDYINTSLFQEKELQRFATSIMAIKTWLKNRGIEYIYVIAPNKHTIYSDKIPEFIIKRNDHSATDQLVSYIKTHTDVTIIDLRPVLLAEKQHHQVYSKNDTHWNHYGANVAQFEIMKHVGILFPEKISPSLLTSSEFKLDRKNTGDLTIIGKITGEEEINPTPIFNEKCTLKSEPSDAKKTHTMVCDTQYLNAVIFGDSFFLALHPYFSRKFNRSTYIWEPLSYEKLVEYIDKENPDIIIEALVERKFPYVPSDTKFTNDLK